MSAAAPRGFRCGRHLPGLAAALILLPALAVAAAADAAPQRIVSFYLCADQLLLHLVEPGRLRSLSNLIDAPVVSTMPGAAKNVARNRGGAEEILAMEPDLAVAGAYTAHATKRLLRRVGIRVLELPLARDFDGVRRNIRRLAAAVAAPARGERLIALLDARLAAIPTATGPAVAGGRPTAVIYHSGGYVQGRGTLGHAVLRRAGFRNLAAAGAGVAQLPLERLLRDPPDAIVLGNIPSGATSHAAESLAHPAFRRLLDGVARIDLAERLWICGLPETVQAVERLAAFRARSLGRGAAR